MAFAITSNKCHNSLKYNVFLIYLNALRDGSATALFVVKRLCRTADTLLSRPGRDPSWFSPGAVDGGDFKLAVFV